jgi:FkbM family methyltransferase
MRSSVKRLIRTALAKLRWWRALFTALHPPLTVRSAITAVVARELEFRALIRQTSSIPVKIDRPVAARLRLRLADLPTLQEVLRQGVYSRLFEFIRSPEWIIDLGAHIGLSSVYFLGNYPTANVLAVEPHPASFALLQHNLRPWIDSGRCRVLHAAAWGADCFLSPETLTVPYPAGFRIEPKSIATEEEPGSIQGFSMSTLIELTPPGKVDLVKIDVEGSEAILFTSDLSWLRAVKCLAVELHDDLRARLSFDELMRRHGFDVVEDGEHTLIALAISEHWPPQG